MAQHIYTGQGDPNVTNPAVGGGSHYFDTATGKQYLQSGGDWVEIGAGGMEWKAIVVDTSATPTVVVDFAYTQMILNAAAGAAPIQLDLRKVSGYHTATGQTQIIVDQPDVGAVIGMNNQAHVRVVLGGGATMADRTVTPPSGGRLKLDILANGADPDDYAIPPWVFVSVIPSVVITATLA